MRRSMLARPRPRMGKSQRQTSARGRRSGPRFGENRCAHPIDPDQTEHGEQELLRTEVGVLGIKPLAAGVDEILPAAPASGGATVENPGTNLAMSNDLRPHRSNRASVSRTQESGESEIRQSVRSIR